MKQNSFFFNLIIFYTSKDQVWQGALSQPFGSRIIFEGFEKEILGGNKLWDQKIIFCGRYIVHVLCIFDRNAQVLENFFDFINSWYEKIKFMREFNLDNTVEFFGFKTKYY